MRGRLVLFLILFTLPIANGTETDDTPRAPDPAVLCHLLLGGNRASFGPNLTFTQLQSALEGHQTAAVLIQWQRTSSYDPQRDPSLRENLIAPDGLSYVMGPTRVDDTDVVALLAGPRRQLTRALTELDEVIGSPVAGYHLLRGFKFEPEAPSQVIQISAQSLGLVEVLLKSRRRPSLSLYDAKTGDIFYAVSNDAFDGLLTEEMGESEVATANDLGAWFGLEIRRRQNHYVRLPFATILSHAAFQTFRRANRKKSDSMVEPSLELAAALDACLEAACGANVPPPLAPRPAPAEEPPRPLIRKFEPTPDPNWRDNLYVYSPGTVRSKGAKQVETTGIDFNREKRVPFPTRERLRLMLNKNSSPERLGGTLSRIFFGDGIPPQQILRARYSLTYLVGELWAHYLPGREPTKLPKIDDGAKILSAPGDHKTARERLRESLGDFLAALDAQEQSGVD